MKNTKMITALGLALLAALAAPARGQEDPGGSEDERPKVTVALEADALSFGLKGYSGIVNLTFRNGWQMAIGEGRYDVPSFLLKGDKNYDQAQWQETATGVQVFRTTYRFKGPRRSGPALGGIVLSQSMRLRSEALGGETRFRQVSSGVTTGYYIYLTKHFYIYPTAAFTYNAVTSGQTAIQGVNYHLPRFGPNGSIHAGWDFGR